MVAEWQCEGEGGLMAGEDGGPVTQPRRVSLLRMIPFFRQTSRTTITTTNVRTTSVFVPPPAPPEEKEEQDLLRKESAPKSDDAPLSASSISTSTQSEFCSVLSAISDLGCPNERPTEVATRSRKKFPPTALARRLPSLSYLEQDSHDDEEAACVCSSRASSSSDSLVDEELYSAPSLSSCSLQMHDFIPSSTGVRAGRSASPVRRALRPQPHKFNSKWRLSSALSFLNSHYGFDRGPIAFDVDSHIGHRARMEDAYSIVLDVTGICPSRLLKHCDFFRSPPSVQYSITSCAADSSTGLNTLSSDDIHRPLLLMFAIFDGHGGSAASDFAKLNFHHILREQLRTSSVMEALHQSILETDTLFAASIAKRSSIDSGFSYYRGNCSTVSPAKAGTTATVVVANPSEGKFWTAHVGDSEAWLFTSSKAVRLLRPHSPLRWDERRRIETSGGMVSKQIIGATGRRIGRVNGVLSVSRAIGDTHLKQWVISTPEITEHSIAGDEEVLVLASDGLWDALEPNLVYIEICTYFSSRLNRSRRGRHLRRRAETPSLMTEDGETPVDMAVRLTRGCAKHLVNLAISRGSSDNVTCIVVLFDGIARQINSMLRGYRFGSYRRRDLKRRMKSALHRLFSGMDSRKTWSPEKPPAAVASAPLGETKSSNKGSSVAFHSLALDG
eukprot:Gregarina_sp_Poly_1__1608@NODE_1407_length_4212_cov_129_277684_g937_i0_p1_GENE_NODE_1407_length_4212_cov_129_277684_g937_i0NODE_1407_length_4212_cov_129_277684_g937_i0_p1_ORF_typecomplete_len671_score76_38PP2C/PF00481_21/3_7e51PP2C_2/PF13672_6/7e15SpoIIE/PF07228_12/2_7e08_NODE_1407_length_4212_cov_129_277684_g937_i09202932